MGRNRIGMEWTDATWNPIGGCSVKSPGCKPCYAMQLAGTRLANHPLYKGTTTRESGRPVFNGAMTAAAAGDQVWTWPLRWRGAKAPKLGAGMPSLIFVGDMADLFHEKRPIAAIDKTVGTILRSQHVGQLLTKRAEDMRDYFHALPDRRRRWDCDSLLDDGDPYGSLWLGFSAERQTEFDERWRHMRDLAALGWIIFVSYEPAMGPLVLPKDFLALGDRAQVIAGGVSGRWPWAPHPDWFRAVRDQCAAAGVAFFFKQWGEHRPRPLRPGCGIVETRGNSPVYWPDGTVGAGHADQRGGLGQDFDSGHKQKNGRLLDGREWNEFPRALAA